MSHCCRMNCIYSSYTSGWCKVLTGSCSHKKLTPLTNALVLTHSCTTLRTSMFNHHRLKLFSLSYNRWKREWLVWWIIWTVVSKKGQRGTKKNTAFFFYLWAKIQIFCGIKVIEYKKMCPFLLIRKVHCFTLHIGYTITRIHFSMDVVLFSKRWLYKCLK